MLVIYFIAHSDWILQRSRADMVNYLKEYFNITSICPLGDNKSEINQTYQNFIDWQINNKKLLDIGGVFNLRKILKIPVANKLFFAGEATTGVYATCHGADLSGERAAKQVLNFI